jgi:hypothetical protein
MSGLTAPTSERVEARANRGGRWSPAGNRPTRAHGHGPRQDAPAALRLLTPPQGETGVEALPALATPGDLREAIQYLKRRPAGVTLTAALADAKRRVFEPRKVEAYESWGFVARRGERLLLTNLGREFARTLEPETRAYRSLLDSNPLYRAALEWVCRQGFDIVTYGDVATFLRERFAPLLNSADAKLTEEGVVCFFHLCQAAGLGTLTIGKRGQPARLRVEREGLADYVERRAAPQHAGDSGRGATREREEADDLSAGDEEADERTRLFVTYGGQPGHVVAQIQTVLELAGIKSHTSRRTPPGEAAVLVADEAAEVMRRCDAALVLLSRDDCRAGESGATAVAERALVEIGAACVLYERRVLLLLDGPFALPAGLAALPHIVLGEGGLTWDVGIELLKAVRGFSGGARRD